MEEAVKISYILVRIVIILIAAKIGGYIAEKLKQPSVLGELAAGIILGPSLFNFINPYEPDSAFQLLHFLGEIGVILLLFQIGLESNIHQLLKAGLTSTLVATIGVAVPVALGFAYSMYAIADIGFNGAFLIGATLAATSVGITMRVLSEIKKVNSHEGKIILGAAVIDDIIGLVILSVVAGLVSGAGQSIPLVVSKTILFSVIFLIASIWLGIRYLPKMYTITRPLKINRTFVFSSFVVMMFFAAVADVIGLATIVGAFAAGLIFERLEEKEHFQAKIQPMAHIFVPIFFVVAGLYLDAKALFLPGMLPLVFALTIIAVVGKLVSGFGAIGTKTSKLAIGIGMIPRGEVGLIFSAFGLAASLITKDIYSALVLVIMITTIVTPPFLVRAMKNIKGTGAISESEQIL